MCVVVWVWRTLIAGIMIYGPRVLLHVDLREPPTLFLGVAQRRSVHAKKVKVLRPTEGFAVHSRLLSNGRYAFELFGR
jgi:hypothetical protein